MITEREVFRYAAYRQAIAVRELVNYILITSQENGDWESFLEPAFEELIVIFMGDLSDDERNDRLKEFFLDVDNVAAASTLVAYLMRYMFDSGMSVEDLDIFYEYFGVNSTLIRAFISIIYQYLDGITDYSQLGYILDTSWNYTSLLMNNPFAIVALLKAMLQTLLLPTVQKYHSLAHYSASVNTVSIEAGKIRDFSQSREEDLLNVICSVEAVAFADMDAWRSYSSEEWYSQLHVEKMYTYLKKYYNALTDADDTSSQRISSVFDNVYGIDSSFGQRLKNRVSDIGTTVAAINNIASGISPEPIESGRFFYKTGVIGTFSEGNDS